MAAERDEINIRFGRFVARRRKSRGLTQAALAEKAKISTSTVTQIESGDYNPSFDMIKKLSDILKYDPSAFFTDNFDQNDNNSKIIRDVVVLISPLSEKKLLEIRDIIRAVVKR